MIYEKYVESANYIKSKMQNITPKTSIILGSGLGVIKDDFNNLSIINYAEIPNFPVSTVPGHAGELLIGYINNIPIIAMNGRFHYYEGYSLDEVTFPIRVFKLLGIENIILTNAAGGINKDFVPGDFMVIDDQISFFAESVLRGKNIEEFGPRFPGMSQIYDASLSLKLKNVLIKYTGKSHSGIYAYMKGPQFESPAEIRALKILGADAVGMSTVPEAIVARHADMNVVGISCITNMAAGIQSNELSHEEVQETSNRVKYTFKNIIKEFISEIN